MKTFLVILAAALPMLAQPPAGDRVSVPFSDPSRPGQLKVELINGSITVKGYSGKEVIVEGAPATARSRQTPPPQGMRRIVPPGSGLEVEEQNNVMSITAPPMGHTDLTIQAPFNTSLKIQTVSGSIRVEGIQADIEADSTNGSVTLENVSGAAVAHALNGRVQANFVQVNPQKPMSFSSMNGTIDVTLPADVKANVKLRSDNGEILSDFDIVTKPGPAVQESRNAQGRRRVRVDRTVYGAINGGGPEIQFSNFNGSIYIRKAGGAAAPR